MYEGIKNLSFSEGLAMYIAPDSSIQFECQLLLGIVQRTVLLECPDCLFRNIKNSDSSEPQNGVLHHVSSDSSTSATKINSCVDHKQSTAGWSSEEDWEDDLWEVDKTLPEIQPLPEYISSSRKSGITTCGLKEYDTTTELLETLLTEKNKSFSHTDPEKITTHRKNDREIVKINSKKLFIHNISYKTSQYQLWDFFKTFGNVQFCQLLTDFKKRSKGRGFVTFSTEEAAQSVLVASEERLTLHDRILRPEVAVWRKPKSTSANNNEDRTDTSLRGNGSASAEVGHINSLPDDIMFVIWSLLSLHHRLRAESVCQRWRYISRRYWRSMTSLNFTGSMKRFGVLTEYILTTLLKRGSQNLMHLDVSASSRLLGDRALTVIGRRCQNLTELDISGSGSGNSGLKAVANGCPNLQTVHLRKCNNIGEDGLWWLFHRCKELRYLNFEDNARLAGQCLHVLGHNVEIMLLERCTKLKDLGIKKLGRQCHSLKELSVQGCTNITDEGLEDIFKIHSLKVLNLCSMREMSLSTFERIGQLLNLQELYLNNNNTGVSDSMLIALGQGCTQLKVLDVSSCGWGVTDTGLMGLVKCQQLLELYLNYLHKVDGSSIAFLALTVPLEKLVARGCGSFTQESLVDTVDHAHHLCHLDVCGNGQLGQRVLQAVVSSLNTYPREIKFYVGGTYIFQDGADYPENMYLYLEDLCQHHLRPGQEFDVYRHLDSDESDSGDYPDDDDLCAEEYQSYEAIAGGIDDSTAYDFLDMDDPLAEEHWNLS